MNIRKSFFVGQWLSMLGQTMMILGESGQAVNVIVFGLILSGVGLLISLLSLFS